MTHEQAVDFVCWCDYLSLSEWQAFLKYWGEWMYDNYVEADAVSKVQIG